MDSLHDLTGDDFLFLFAGKRKDKAPWDSPLHHEKYRRPGLVTPCISLPGAGQFLVPDTVYPRQNQLVSAHTQSISELRDYFHLSELDVPSLLFLPTFPHSHSKKIVIPLQIFSSLYDLFHRAEFPRPNLDIYLQKLYNTESDLIVVFFCEEYQRKKWCGLEWRAIRDLINQRNNDGRVMLVKCGDVEIEGLFATTDGFFDARDMTKKDIEKLISGIIKRFEDLR